MTKFGFVSRKLKIIDRIRVRLGFINRVRVDLKVIGLGLIVDTFKSTSTLTLVLNHKLTLFKPNPETLD